MAGHPFTPANIRLVLVGPDRHSQPERELLGEPGNPLAQRERERELGTTPERPEILDLFGFFEILENPREKKKRTKKFSIFLSTNFKI